MPEARLASLRHQKSTIGRSNVLLSTVRPLFRGLSHVAPSMATRVAGEIFFRPPKARVPLRESWWATEAEEMTVMFGAGKLKAWRWGWGGRRVLLVHGWGGRGLQLGALAAPLVEAGFEVIAFDGPGHGESTGERSSLPEMADAIGTMVRSLDGVEAIVAHSFGAAACTSALSVHHMEPQVNRLVYLAPAVDLVWLTDHFVDMVGFAPDIAGRLRQGIEDRFGVPFEDFQSLKLARDLKHPLLVIHDRDDAEVPYEGGEALAQTWAGAELQSTRGLGHRRLLRDAAVIGDIVSYLN